MHGATNIRRHLLAATEAADSPRVVGMCDAPEAPFFVRALRRVGCAVEGPTDLPRWGFQVCHRDLEDELMRDLGESGTREVVEALGLTQRFAMLTQQPAWQSGSFHEQVHRFAGAASGRKELMGAALAEALDVDALPTPLAGLLDAIGAPPAHHRRAAVDAAHRNRTVQRTRRREEARHGGAMTTAALAPRPAPLASRPRAAPARRPPGRRRGARPGRAVHPRHRDRQRARRTHAPAHVRVAAVADSVVGVVASGKNDV